jgi:hypothetical protein
MTPISLSSYASADLTLCKFGPSAELFAKVINSNRAEDASHAQAAEKTDTPMDTQIDEERSCKDNASTSNSRPPNAIPSKEGCSIFGIRLFDNQAN